MMDDSPDDFTVEADEPPRKILFLGDENVGKTTFIRKYCEYKRDHCRCDTYQGTFLAFTQFLLYYRRFERHIPIRLLDLPTGSTEASRRDQYPAVVNLIVLCYAVDNMTSFNNIWRRWLPEFREYYPLSTRFYLLALKTDLRLQLEAVGKTPVPEDLGRRVHKLYSFSGDYLDCTVEANPERARNFMETLIDDTFVHSPPQPEI